MAGVLGSLVVAGISAATPLAALAAPAGAPLSSLEKLQRNVTDGGSATAAPIMLAGSDVIEYVLTARNGGTAAATHVTITDPLPGHLTLLSCGGCTRAGSVLHWTRSSLGARESWSVSLTARLDTVFPTGTTVISNAASVASDQERSRSSNPVVATVTVAFGVLGSPPPPPVTHPTPATRAVTRRATTAVTPPQVSGTVPIPNTGGSPPIASGLALVVAGLIVCVVGMRHGARRRGR